MRKHRLITSPTMKKTFPVFALLLLAFTSCKVDFSPNAPWREVPSVYCVIDPDEDTVWARVQKCYLGEDNLYNYSSIVDSNYYLSNQIAVHLLAWRGNPDDENTRSILVDRWVFNYTEIQGKPEGDFPAGLQPIYYCVPGRKLKADTACFFQLLVLRNPSGDTLARATTKLVGFRDLTIHLRDTVEEVLEEPNSLKGHNFRIERGDIKATWKPVPGGRRYQPIVTFYYKRNHDTCSLVIPGKTFPQAGSAKAYLSESRFLSIIKNHLKDNTDTLTTVNNVDITIAVCNEDLTAYINSHDRSIMGGQETQTYTNIKGGVGVFASRRTHITVNVPSDSLGNTNNLPQKLVDLGVGFYGHF